jgi:hypothetical protein
MSHLSLHDDSAPSTQHDVVICGGGPAGVAAALAAARAGAHTLLIERYGFIGGAATAALVNPIAGHEFRPSGSTAVQSLIQGVFGEVFTLLHAQGGYGSDLTQPAFDEERLKLIYDDLLQQAGVDVLCHRSLTGATREGRRIALVHSHGKDGFASHAGQVFIDGTGDGDLAALSGCACRIGRPTDALCQAMTTNFRVAGVDKPGMLSALARSGQIRHHKPARLLVDGYFQRARAEGRLDYPHREWIHFYDYPRPGVLHFNMTRVHRLSGLAAAELTTAEIACRRQAALLTDWLVRDVPWFRGAWLEKLATQVGVRETRHITGRYTMTAADVTAARKFDDGIARSAYFIDIHSPTGAGFDHEITGSRGAVADRYAVPADDWYEVPYRALLPVDVDNLLVPCRALSATHEAAAAVRVMATLHATGEAAGLAAALAVAGGTTPGMLDGRELRRRIGYLDQPPVGGLPWDNHPL